MAHFPYRSKRGDTRLPEQVRQVVESLPYGRIGVYILRDGHGEILRIGHSRDLRHRIVYYFRAGAGSWPSEVVSVEVIFADSERLARQLEKELIAKHCPPYNVLHNPDGGSVW